VSKPYANSCKSGQTSLTPFLSRRYRSSDSEGHSGLRGRIVGCLGSQTIVGHDRRVERTGLVRTSKNDEDAGSIGRSVLRNVNAAGYAVLAWSPLGNDFDRAKSRHIRLLAGLADTRSTPRDMDEIDRCWNGLMRGSVQDGRKPIDRARGKVGWARGRRQGGQSRK
jgi:hypothetical protein